MIRAIRSALTSGLILAALAAAPALANPCGIDQARSATVKGYDVGQTAMPEDQEKRLIEFADTAAHASNVCVFAQVDKQGAPAANQEVADARAAAVVRFLTDLGVKPDRIQTATQAEAVTLFGLLDNDQPDDRRVVVSHD